MREIAVLRAQLLQLETLVKEKEDLDARRHEQLGTVLRSMDQSFGILVKRTEAPLVLASMRMPFVGTVAITVERRKR